MPWRTKAHEGESAGSLRQRVFRNWNLRLFRRGQPEPHVLQFHAAIEPRLADQAELRDVALELTQGNTSLLSNMLETLEDDVAAKVGLCEQVMDTYADFWADDTCGDADIAIGLALALSTFRLHSTSTDDCLVADVDGPLLVVPVPGESHILSAVLASAMLPVSGFDVSYRPTADNRELGGLIESGSYRGVVLASSGVYSRSSRLDAIQAASDAVRRHAADIKIALYGRVSRLGGDMLGLLAGIDAVCPTALELLRYFEKNARRLH